MQTTSQTITLKNWYDRRRKEPSTIILRPVTIADIRNFRHGQLLWFRVNQDNNFVAQLRVTSAVKTWKRDPNRLACSFKHGIYENARMETAEMLRRLYVEVDS